MNGQQWSVGILIFDDVEVLDFAGPFEVFSVAANPVTNQNPFTVKTISENGEMVTARNGLKVYPDFSFDNAPRFDILVIPGGPGARETEIHNVNLIEWIQDRMHDVQIMTSVCTGALLLAKAGILNGKRATTHWGSYDRLESEFPSVLVQRNVKFVDEGAIITSGGISAGINMSLHIVKRLVGSEIAQETARRMEYDTSIS
ncbi:MAG: AraC family transcriptional regulator [Sulfobacillus thermosulfidooxidans]|uniref:AraC family transcriptional regulator n=1 Tax=Sulfobacillus thermosulfidooxidans TaxID=28034 RepID=A0A2T2WSU2_SULTH|nr:MAG: AraC family transcriptional regulator [Sulfobacillus thermosulfidooxidans]